MVDFMKVSKHLVLMALLGLSATLNCAAEVLQDGDMHPAAMHQGNPQMMSWEAIDRLRMSGTAGAQEWAKELQTAKIAAEIH